MKIFYFVRSLEAVPSCMYNIQMLADSGYETIVVSGRSTESLNKVMESKNIKYFDGKAKIGKNRILNRLARTSAFNNALKEAAQYMESDDIIIYGTGDTAMFVGHRFKKYRRVLSLKELHEHPWYYPIYLKKLAKKCAAVICCEKNRACVLQFRWGLKDRPYTISNKPYGYPTEKYLKPTCEKTEKIISQISSEKVVVYQARHIHFAKELINLARALKATGDDYQLVLIGEVDNPKDKVKISEIYPNILWTGHISAPMHLEVTSYAKLGVAVYSESSLNNLFCAPNKTYEYAGFGIPTLCNDVPGLVETIGVKRAGMCVDWNDVDSIKDGIETIFADYEKFSEEAKNFYISEDNRFKLEQIILNIKGDRKND